MTIRNNTPKASQRRHFINRRCCVARATVTESTLIVSPVRAILYFATMCHPIRGLGRSVGFLSVGCASLHLRLIKYCPCRTKGNTNLGGIIADSHKKLLLVSVCVQIWAETGKPAKVTFNNGVSYSFDENLGSTKKRIAYEII
jgi:hypothetical protein